ncbi:MAG: hypothetical protein V3574_02820 [Candidatus Moraniibacteriota bacterium]
MTQVFVLFYLFFLLGVFITGTFIIYHILKYSINKNSSTLMLIIFISGLIVLVLINFFAFSSIDLENVLDFGLGMGTYNQSF